jgi:hypothetical protein
MLADIVVRCVPKEDSWRRNFDRQNVFGNPAYSSTSRGMVDTITPIEHEAITLPTTKREQNRLNMIHHVFYRLLNDRLFLAPIDLSGMRILDIGADTGI